MGTYFINKAIDQAIADYLKSKDKPESILYNSFLVVVIRLLISIYGELDIINPYHMNDEEALNINLMKYGSNLEKINNLKRLIDGYLKIEEKNKNGVEKEENIYFIEIQKEIIDLFTLKRVNYGVSESEQKLFFDLLYTPGTSNVLRQSINYQYASDIYEVAKYYKEKSAIQGKDSKEKKELLNFNVYREFNIGINDLSKMSNSQIQSLNKQIYQAFDIKDNTMNKENILNEKLNEINKSRRLLTTGNGYVDILLIMSVIVTTIMVITVVSFLT